MSLERLVEEILDLGERESQEILASAQEQRERMLADVRARTESLMKDKESQAEEQASRERLREMARAELESKRMVLQAQREVLDQVLKEAREGLRNSAPHEELLKVLVKAHTEEISDGIILCTKEEAPVLRRLVEAEVKDELDGIGGFIIESRDGSRRVNLTFETLLDDLWEEVVKEVADILLGEE